MTDFSLRRGVPPGYLLATWLLVYGRQLAGCLAQSLWRFPPAAGINPVILALTRVPNVLVGKSRQILQRQRTVTHPPAWQAKVFTRPESEIPEGNESQTRIPRMNPRLDWIPDSDPHNAAGINPVILALTVKVVKYYNAQEQLPPTCLARPSFYTTRVWDPRCPNVLVGKSRQILQRPRTVTHPPAWQARVFTRPESETPEGNESQTRIPRMNPRLASKE